MTKRSKDVQSSVTFKLPVMPGDAPRNAFDPIAAALQQIHSKVTDEEIPDDFMRLLDKFDVEDAT
jgi:hypothetical protein